MEVLDESRARHESHVDARRERTEEIERAGSGATVLEVGPGGPIESDDNRRRLVGGREHVGVRGGEGLGRHPVVPAFAPSEDAPHVVAAGVFVVAVVGRRLGVVVATECGGERLRYVEDTLVNLVGVEGVVRLSEVGVGGRERREERVEGVGRPLGVTRPHVPNLRGQRRLAGPQDGHAGLALAMVGVVAVCVAHAGRSSQRGRPPSRPV